MIREDLINNAFSVLADCKGPNGLRASAEVSANYDAYFTRDTVINSLGLSLIGKKDLLPHLENQLKQLKLLQGAEGQIASNFTTSSMSGIEVSFGTLTPKLDGPSWFVIGVCHLIEQSLIDRSEWKDSVMKALSVLDALDYNGSGLIYCPMGSDWADEYICQGYVLHVQLLRAWALRAAGMVFEEKYLNAQAEKIKEVLEVRFSKAPAEEGDPRYLYSSFTQSDRVEQFDLASNILFAFLFPDEALSNEILDYIRAQFLSKDILPAAFSPEIREGDEKWSALRSFHLFEFKNQPGHYHNGGAWWIWHGWYAMVLQRRGHVVDLLKLQSIVERFFKGRSAFEFKEYVTPDSQEGGQGQMAFTASGLIMLQRIFSVHG